MFRKIAFFLTILITFVSVGCDDSNEEFVNSNVAFADTYNADDTWLVYWYICGSNLETEGQAATIDLTEMFNSHIPSNVKVLIQAGGSNQWHNSIIKENQINRCLFDGENLYELETLPDADMGSSATLADFLRYGKNNFNVDHKVFIFWDHGGGSVGGICQDERTGNSLSLNDVREAFESVYPSSVEDPPFEMIGFDACLMATYDNANNLHGLTRYMTASEEIEPGCGWEYTGWLNALGENPAMNGAKLGQIICDTYIAGCAQYNVENSATLSVIDISKMPNLQSAYENFGVEALRLSAQNPQKFFSSFSRSANSAENYGGNTRESGYFDMVDLGDLAKKSKTLLPQTSQQLINSINDAVIYKVHGIYRDQGSGISGFYPYDGGNQLFNMYSHISAAPLVSKCLYYHLIYGTMPEAGKFILDNIQIDTPQSEITTPTQKQNIFNIADLEDTKIQIDNENNAFVQLNEAQMDLLSSVHCLLAYVDVEDDLVLFLGSDANVNADWENGVFSDNFDGTWPMLDGHPVYVEIVSEAEVDEYGNVQGYNLYSVPIKLNDVRCNLQIAYDHKIGQYEILGARRENISGGMADRNLIKLKAGDKITTIHYTMTISGDEDDFTEVEAETFTINNNPKFEDEEMGDGEYGYLFEFITPDNNTADSELVHFSIRDGEIFTSLIED